MQNSHPLSCLWPSIENRETARSACALGMLAAFAAALWSAGFGVFAWSNNGHVGPFLVPLVPLARHRSDLRVVGSRHSSRLRAAAVTAGVMFVLQQGASSSGIVIWFDSVLPQLLVLVGAFALFFASGVRGLLFISGF